MGEVLSEHTHLLLECMPLLRVTANPHPGSRVIILLPPSSFFSAPFPPFLSYSFSVPAAILLLPAPSTAATAALLLAPPDAAGVSTKPSTQGASKQATTKATSRSMATLTPLLRWANGMMMMMTINGDQRRGWSLSVKVLACLARSATRLLLKEKGRD